MSYYFLCEKTSTYDSPNSKYFEIFWFKIDTTICNSMRLTVKTFEQFSASWQGFIWL